jgi:hypothetical protein
MPEAQQRANTNATEAARIPADRRGLRAAGGAGAAACESLAATASDDTTVAVGRFLKSHWALAASALLLSLGLAGFTGSSWWDGASRSRLFPPEVAGEPHALLGAARMVRSDEWSIDTPSARAQQLAVPRFPLVNLGEGLGQLQRSVGDAPVADWGLPFRPLLWPLLVFGRWSQGVHWFLRSALLLAGVYLFLSAIAFRQGRQDGERQEAALLCGLAACAVFFSSAMTWWLSNLISEQILWACLTAAAGASAARARSPAGRALLLGATAYLSACTFFVFYPPLWVPLALLVACAIADAHLRALGGRAAVRAALPLLLAVAVGAAISLVYYAPLIALLRTTAYPGRRVAEAGGLPVGRLVDLVWPSLAGFVSGEDAPRQLVADASNVCESSAVEALPLGVLLGFSTASTRVRKAFVRAIAASPFLFAAFAVFSIWLLLPLPDGATRLLLMQWSPWYRAWVVYGLMAAALALLVLVELPTREEPGLPGIELAGGLAALLALLVAGYLRAPGSELAAVDRWLHFVPVLVAASLSALACARMGTRSAARLLAIAWALPLLLANHAVNPLVPTRSLFAEGPGHAAIARALAAEPGRLLDYSTHRANWLAGYGFPVLAAVQLAPDLDFFAFLAPDAPGLREELYNRYAQVQFAMPPGSSSLLGVDALEVSLSPCSRRLSALFVNHLLTWPFDPLPPGCDGWSVRRAGALLLWSRKDPVCPLGVSRTAAGEVELDPVDFDYSCSAGGGAVGMEKRRDGLRVTFPAGSVGQFALAINLSIVDAVSCTAARWRSAGAHLVFAPDSAGGAECRISYLGSRGGIRRLLGAPAGGRSAGWRRDGAGS